ncbi:MAG: excinuclease ABC subunit UvrB [Patescibacteria group bacterium]
MFKLKSPYKPTGDQPEAIEKLVAGPAQQVLLGVTGSGKTFTMANVIQTLQKPTLIISHNKTLAAQLYQEFRDYFPENAVSYFVSYYDYYQPEAYIPQSDTYIEKETNINDQIDKLRLAATTNLLTRKDVIVVSSVSCIYNLGSPVEYGKTILELAVGLKITRDQILMRLNDLQYSRSDYSFHRGTYRVRGEIVDICLAYEDSAIRLTHDGAKITKLEKIDPISGTTMNYELKTMNIYPAKHYIAGRDNQAEVFQQIRHDLDIQIAKFKSEGKMLEAHRINQRVNYDLEMIQELGFVNGIENYSRYFDSRNPGDPPYSLMDYFPKDYLLIIDESHMTVPQIRGMYNGDKSRKQTLIDYGFRLPAALDNRPLKFDEFMRRIGGHTFYVSATPDEWEVSQSEGHVVEQLVRPTGLVDPTIEILPTVNQIQDLESRIQHLISKGQRALVTTLTKRMAEDLSSYLDERGYKVHYLHSDVDTLERLDILDDLRKGTYDVIVGINLLREGLDLPEVSLVAILDADKEGFLRSRTSLIQTMGRAARHKEGQVIMYADKMTDSMKAAIDEVSRRRQVQMDYNAKHGVTPKSITKAIRERIVEKEIETPDIDMSKVSQLVPSDLSRLIRQMTRQMNSAARAMEFEEAARLRDHIREIQNS